LEHKSEVFVRVFHQIVFPRIKKHESPTIPTKLFFTKHVCKRWGEKTNKEYIMKPIPPPTNMAYKLVHFQLQMVGERAS
jgi:hypothetical protein